MDKSYSPQQTMQIEQFSSIDILYNLWYYINSLVPLGLALFITSNTYDSLSFCNPGASTPTIMLRISAILEKEHYSLVSPIYSTEKSAEEKFAQKYLANLPARNYIVLSNLLLENGNRTAQIDNIVVSPFGIFVIEEKSHHGNVWGVGYSPMWRTYYNYSDGQKFIPFQNPLIQNLFHISALKKILPLEIHHAIISVISFTETPHIHFKGKLKEKGFIVSSEYLREAILSENQPILSESEIWNIVSTIKRANIMSSTNLQKHIAQCKMLSK